MTNITWGPEIPIDGKRPEWLTDDATPVLWAKGSVRFLYSSTAGTLTWGKYLSAERGNENAVVDSIQLPADNPHYAKAPTTTLWREVDALGVSGKDMFAHGFRYARGCILAILERRGFTEHADAPGQAASAFGGPTAARIAEVLQEECGFWKACSGCQESNDGYVSTKHYPHDPVFQCQPGSGCCECGGIGVLWDTTDYDRMARDMLAGDAEAGNIPAGWRLVPEVPTSEMTEAGDAIIIYHPDDIIRNQADPCWSAMLAACPPTPAEGAAIVLPSKREWRERWEEMSQRSGTSLNCDALDTARSFNLIRDDDPQPGSYEAIAAKYPGFSRADYDEIKGEGK